MRSKPVVRRSRQVIMVLFVCVAVGCVGMVIGPFLNDRAIDAGGAGRALAEVTGVSGTRTTVEFRDDEGFYHAPARGLLYPTGLGEGQNVWVNYSTNDPDLVKVEGRGWTLSVIPALSVFAASVVLTGLLWWLTGLPGRMRRRRQQ